MGTSTIQKKSLISDTVCSSLEHDLELINKHTLAPLCSDDVFIFKVRLCDNDIDRVGDKMSSDFLRAVADNIVGLTGLRDHDWSSNNQTARLFDAEVVTDDTLKNKLGEPLQYVLGKAYTLNKFTDYVDKIKAGLLKETSISFESTGDTCSICGEEMLKDYDGVAHCKNGHCAGSIYDGVLCYNNITNLKDLLEWSLVAVPCQKEAGISNKSLGGKIMNRAEFLIRQFMSGKSYTKEDKAELDNVLNDSAENKELTDEDIKALLDENEALKVRVKELEDKIEAVESERALDNKKSIVGKALDDVGLITPDVKDLLMKEIPFDDLELEDGQIPGLEDVFSELKNKYKGLFVVDGDGDKIEEPVDGAVDDLVDDNKHEKSLKKPSGITFGSTKKSYGGTVKNSNIKPGIYF